MESNLEKLSNYGKVVIECIEKDPIFRLSTFVDGQLVSLVENRSITEATKLALGWFETADRWKKHER